MRRRARPPLPRPPAQFTFPERLFPVFGSRAGAVAWTYRADPHREFARARATAFTRWAKARPAAPAA